MNQQPIKIGIGIPSPDRIHPDFAIHCLTSIIAYTREHLPHIKLDIRHESGVRTDRNRNIILTDFIEAKEDYVLWLDCLVGDTPLLVRRNDFIDYVEIQELIPESERHIRGRTYTSVPLEVMTRDGWQNINAVRQLRTNKKIKRVSGECVFSATEDHRVFVDGKERYVNKLSSGDKIDRSDFIDKNDYNPWTNEFAEMAGFFMAEGSSNKYKNGYQWYLCNSKIEYLKKYQKTIEAFFSEKTYIVADGKNMHKLYATNPKNLYNFFRHNFYSSSGNKKVPTQILNSNADTAKAYLKGFLLGDGHVDDRGRISLTEKSNIGMAGLTYLYKKLGEQIRFHIRDDKDTIQGFLTQNRRKSGVNKILDQQDEQWVYDINTDSGSFVGGVGDACFHNCDMIFPADIIERFLEVKKFEKEPALIGCLYFKRTPDYNPIGYVDSDNPQQPYRPVMPQLIQKGKIYEVTGLGYGGMMVPMAIYEKMGVDKWTHYGDNFHNPHATSGNLTHDLEFCRSVKKAGFKIFMHGSVRPGHIGEKLITEEDFYNKFPPKLLKGLTVDVVMPTTDLEQAKKTAEALKARAGYSCDIKIVEDKKRVGYVKTINSAFRDSKANFFVYTAQDAFPGQNWLANALIEQFRTQAELVSFNDGKWNGQLAGFGLVARTWGITNYNGDLFYSGYHSHYGDTELTQIAKEKGTFTHAKEAIMLEVDYIKAIGESRGVVKADKKLYKKRIKKLVDRERAEEFG